MQFVNYDNPSDKSVALASVRYCSSRLQVMWKYLTDIHRSFPANLMMVLKFGLYLPKLFYFIACNTTTVHSGCGTEIFDIFQF